jgi:hypothetical protein
MEAPMYSLPQTELQQLYGELDAIRQLLTYFENRQTTLREQLVEFTVQAMETEPEPAAHQPSSHHTATTGEEYLARMMAT